MEGRDLRRAKELEAAVAAEQRGAPSSPRAQMAALHRRVGRCILLLARFVTSRSKEEEKGAATGDLYGRVEGGAAGQTGDIFLMYISGFVTKVFCVAAPVACESKKYDQRVPGGLVLRSPVHGIVIRIVMIPNPVPSLRRRGHAHRRCKRN